MRYAMIAGMTSLCLLSAGRRPAAGAGPATKPAAAAADVGAAERKVLKDLEAAGEKYRTIRHGRGPMGCRYYGGTSSISANVPSGAVVPATPDGRKAWVPLAEGSSPASGTDVNGYRQLFRMVLATSC